MLRPAYVQEEPEPHYVSDAGIPYYGMGKDKERMRVPFVPIYAYAMYLEACREGKKWYATEYFDFPVEQTYNGKYMAFEIKGDSMDDDSKRSLSQGDIVRARELDRALWKQPLHVDSFPNWIIVLDNNILCKQIVEHDVVKGTIVCHSLNPSPEYTDFTVDLNDVIKLFNIVQRVSSSF